MRMPTFGEKLGLTVEDSSLLRKAAGVGLQSPALLESLAVARGCWHYNNPGVVAAPDVQESEFSNAELAVALLSPCLPYSPHTIRLGAAMLGAQDNHAASLARLAVTEHAVLAVRYIATAALRFEPANPFWRQLLDSLPDAPPPPDGVMPHPTRFVEMTGIDRGRVGLLAKWVRPLQTAAV